MLFTTENAGANQLYSGLLGPGFNCWDHVTVEIWVPWFIVTLLTEDGGIELSSSVFLHQPIQIEGLVDSENSHVDRVQLMQPDKKLCSGWDLREVIEISKVSTQSAAIKYYEVVLTDDLVINFPRDFEQLPDEQITSKKTLWRSKIK